MVKPLQEKDLHFRFLSRHSCEADYQHLQDGDEMETGGHIEEVVREVVSRLHEDRPTCKHVHKLHRLEYEHKLKHVHKLGLNMNKPDTPTFLNDQPDPDEFYLYTRDPDPPTYTVEQNYMHVHVHGPASDGMHPTSNAPPNEHITERLIVDGTLPGPPNTSPCMQPYCAFTLLNIENSTLPGTATIPVSKNNLSHKKLSAHTLSTRDTEIIMSLANKGNTVVILSTSHLNDKKHMNY